eukprot:COSAG04_NODE_1456_length_6639_cov_83.154281_7_plen_159_part_01
MAAQEREWGGISPEAKDLVTLMLKIDPAQRIPASRVLEHPWIKANVNPLGNKPTHSPLASQPEDCLVVLTVADWGCLVAVGEGEAAASPRTAHLSLSQSNLKTFSGKREFKALVNKQLFMQRVSGQVAEKGLCLNHSRSTSSSAIAEAEAAECTAQPAA